MKLIAEYLERAREFERLAANERDSSKLKTKFQKQAQAYRKLAEKRAKETGLLMPNDDQISN